MKIRWWRDEFKVGIVIIVAAALLSIMLLRTSQWEFTSDSEEVKIRFGYVGGLLKSAPVHMYGTKIGKVTEIELVGNGVEVTVQLNETVYMREGYQIFIDILGLVGEKYIEILNGPVEKPITQDKPLKGIDPVSIGHVLMKANEITDKTLKTMDFLQSFISTNEKEIHASVVELKKLLAESRDSFKRTMSNADTALARINGLTGQTKGNIAQTAANLNAFTESLNTDRAQISSSIQDLTDGLNQLVTRTAPAIETSLENLQKATEDLPASTESVNQHVAELSKSASQLMAKLDDMATSSDQKLQKSLDDFGESAATLTGMVDRINELVEEIGSGQGTLGKLITDDGGYEQFSETMSASKHAAEDISNITRSLDGKIRFFDTISTKKGYELSYNSLSDSLQNQFTLSSTHLDLYFYLAGLSVRKGKLTYNLQAGRKFGNLTARVGSIRSKVGVGLDYWQFSRRVGISLEGLDVTSGHPELDLKVAVRMVGGWYFIFGAENLTNFDTSFNFGFRTEIEQ